MSDQAPVELSNRELQVLELAATGASNQEIAHQLVISVNTVKVHMRNIFNKLEVQSRTEASLRAIQEGLIAMPEMEGEADEEEAEEAKELGTPLKTFLLEANPPLVLPQWQQIYLAVALLAALAIATVPLFVQRSRPAAPDLPVIYVQPATPTPPPAAANGQQRGRWINHNAMPTSRAGLALAAFEQKVFAIGGVRDNNKATRSVEIYDALSQSWTEGATKPTAAANIAGVLLDDKIYVPGGCTNQGQAIDALEIYDPQTDRWSQGAPLPAARCGYALTSFEGNLYLFGGWNGTQFEDTIFVYSPDSDRWETLEQTLPHPLGYAGAAVLNNSIYLVGGYDGQAEFDQTYAFEPETGRWEEKTPLNEPRGGLGLISSPTHLYAIGGGWEHASTTSERYDPKTNAWTPFDAPLDGQWRNLGLTSIDTTIYAAGGWNGSEGEFMDSLASYQFIYQLFLPISGFRSN